LRTSLILAAVMLAFCPYLKSQTVGVDGTGLFTCTKNAAGAPCTINANNTAAPGGTPSLGNQVVGNGTGAIYQAKPVLDVRDTVGVDCTGTSDSASALNTLFSSISSRKIIIPQDCKIQINSQLLISGQTNFVLEGEGTRANAGSSSTPVIFGCSGSAGALLAINRSSFWTIKGITFVAKGPSCTSSFTKGVEIQNIGGAGVTPLDGIIEQSGFTSSLAGTAIGNFIGIDIPSNSGNTEGNRFLHNWIHCQNSTNSYGIRVASQFSDIDVAEGNYIAGCFQAIRQEMGNIRIEKNEFGGDGAFSTFGANGADIFIGSCSSGPTVIMNNQADGGGPFINSNNDMSGGCGSGEVIISNQMGVSDTSTSAYAVNVGTATAPHVLIGNQLNITQTGITVSAIGSSSQTNCTNGPLGTLTDIGNMNQVPASTAGWAGCVGGPDFQYGHFQAMSQIDATAATRGLIKVVSGSLAGSWQVPNCAVDGTFANLGTPANGTQCYCTNCNSTCTAGGSTGRMCFRENGAWTH
jgi:hypothetical protein